MNGITWKFDLSLIYLFVILTKFIETAHATDATEGRVIAECLERYGGYTTENAERLKRFKQWSINYEEIPCFTNCYLSKLYDFYNETGGFHKQNVIKLFGEPVYEVCKDKLTEGNNECEIAYHGFHCMVSLENDPFIVIDGMENLHMDAKLAMKECLHKFDRFEWQRFGDYSRFPVREPIPCYTRCFVEKLQLFNNRSNKWDVLAMKTKLGIPSENANIDACLAMGNMRNRNTCGWLYREFTCFIMSKPAN